MEAASRLARFDMALNSFSSFNYGHVVTSSNFSINFDEGGGELEAQIAIGDYTLGEYVIAIQTAMNSVATTNIYSVSVNRADGSITITSDTAPFSLLVATGTQIGTTAFTLMGFTGADRTLSQTYSGNLRSGFQYRAQTKLQDYQPKESLQDFIQPTVNESADGVIEVISFGTRNFIELSIPFITDIVPQDNQFIKSNPTGVDDAIDFLSNITSKAKFEFVPDIDVQNTFEKVILESTPSAETGTGFRLEERVNDNLPGYYRTGRLKLRVVS